MSFHTRGLSWLTPDDAAVVRAFRDTSERLGFRGAVSPDIWAEIERDHIRASSALCHLIADLRGHRRMPPALVAEGFDVLTPTQRAEFRRYVASLQAKKGQGKTTHRRKRSSTGKKP